MALAEQIAKYGDWSDSEFAKDLDNLAQAATDLRKIL